MRLTRLVLAMRLGKADLDMVSLYYCDRCYRGFLLNLFFSPGQVQEQDVKKRTVPPGVRQDSISRHLALVNTPVLATLSGAREYPRWLVGEHPSLS